MNKICLNQWAVNRLLNIRLWLKIYHSLIRQKQSLCICLFMNITASISITSGCIQSLICTWFIAPFCQVPTYKTIRTRSTQRAQTSLAEADHYSHIAHCKNVEPWLWKTTHPLKKKKKKKKKRFWIITCTMIWVCYHYYVVFLLIYSSYNTQITTKI